MARKPSNTLSDDQKNKLNTVDDIKNLDSAVQRLLNQSMSTIVGGSSTNDISNLYDEFNSLIRMDSYNFMKSKNSNMSSYSYLSNALLGRRPDDATTNKKSSKVLDDINARLNLERIFQEGDAQAAAIFLNQSSDIVHFCDEVESVCAYLYQLDEAVNILRDNIMNTEQTIIRTPFDITFTETSNSTQEYIKAFQDAYIESGMLTKLKNHVIPKTLKFGRYYVFTIPYSEIGVKLIQTNSNHTRNIFNFMSGNTNTFSGVGEHQEVINESYNVCMENVDIILDNLFDNNVNEIITKKSGISSNKEQLRDIIENNLKNLFVNEEETPPNIIGVSESSMLSSETPEDLQKLIDKALKQNKVNTPKYKGPQDQNGKPNNTEDSHIADATIDPETLKDIVGCYIKLVDPRTIVPIIIMEHTIGYYYLENYDYSRMGTSITDLLSNQINFNDQNLVVDSIVGAVLKNLKYGDLLNGNNDFKSLILNCVLYAERRQNPIRIKFIPVEYVTEFKTNLDENGNGQSILTKSVVFGRLYISLLLFTITTIITKSTDTEFYYLKEGLLSESYEDQVSNIIEQFRNSNIDISQILSGNLMHGNRAINKRFFMCTGQGDDKPINMEVVSGQNIDTHTEFLDGLKKMSIGSSGVPAVATDYMDEVEFAQILKMTHTKVLTKSNDIQEDMNPSITELGKKLVRFMKPNSIPEEILKTASCALKKNNTISNNITSDEINNNIATVDNMIETYFKGQNTETPEFTEYVKEEMRDKLIRHISPSLPWSYMDSILDDCIVGAKVRQQRDKMRSDNSTETSEM